MEAPDTRIPLYRRWWDLLSLGKPDLTGNERKYLLEAFDAGFLSHQGIWEGMLESSFARWVGAKSIATSSGTGALHIALLAAGVGRGDEVILPTLTFGATASVVVQCGAKPVFVDVTEDFTLRWEDVFKKRTKRTKAVIPVHLYGMPCGIPKEDTGLTIIEDACEALGIIQPSGDFTAFSFYANKAMTTGEGGMLCGKDLSKAVKYRDGGFTKDYDMEVPGLNYRMTNLQAAIGCAQLERLDSLVEKRRSNAQLYGQMLEGKGEWLFVAKVSNPIHVAEELKKEGVETRPVFKPLHLTQTFRQDVKYRMAEQIWESGICLPTGPHVSQEQIKRIAEIVSEHHNLQ